MQTVACLQYQIEAMKYMIPKAAELEEKLNSENLSSVSFEIEQVGGFGPCSPCGLVCRKFGLYVKPKEKIITPHTCRQAGRPPPACLQPGSHPNRGE